MRIARFWSRAMWIECVLVHKQCMVAEHRRSWGKEGVFFNYLHYLQLLERKPGAIDHARPMADLNLPDCFDVLRRRLENEQQKQGDGTREFIRVLRLLEDYPMSRLEGAVEKGLAMRVHSRDAIAQFLSPRPSLQRSTFLLDGQKHLLPSAGGQTRYVCLPDPALQGGEPWTARINRRCCWSII